MADYAATCFEGDALAWYTELEDEVQESWKKLRTNLLRKYPPVSGSSNPLFTVPHPTTVPVAPAGGVAPATNPSQPQGYMGRIEVLASHTVIQGYLSFNPTSGIDITTDKDKAVIFSVPAGVASGILHLDMVRLDGVTSPLPNVLLSLFWIFFQLRSPDRVFPYLGLALLVPQGGDRNVVPGLLPEIRQQRQTQFVGRREFTISITTGVPEPSAICQSPPSTNHNVQKVAFATWTFSACGES